MYKRDQAARAEKRGGRTRDRVKRGGNNKGHTNILPEVVGFGAFKPLVGLFYSFFPPNKVADWWLIGYQGGGEREVESGEVMMHFLCTAWMEIQHGRKREALLTQQWGGPCDRQTRQESLA